MELQAVFNEWERLRNEEAKRQPFFILIAARAEKDFIDGTIDNKWNRHMVEHHIYSEKIEELKELKIKVNEERNK